MSFKTISPEQHATFISALRSGQYNLLLGAGSSMDSSNSCGPLPSGNQLKNDLCKLKGVSDTYSLQRVFSLLTPAEIEEHVYRRFVHATPGPTATLISSFVWKRIFTWNIDDVLESAYRSKIARQKLNSLHFSDEYLDAHNLAELILVHLHGSVSVPEKGYVFSRNEYINQIRNISHWMTILTQFMQTEPMIIAGTSMDEIDLDFYLAHRTQVSSRDDRGPSILVEKTDDAITADLCGKHNLLHFIGHSHDFFEFCSHVLPHRPTPLELIPHETQKVLPAGISKSVALAFHADFEMVPASAEGSDEPSRFLYGHPPSWVDLASDLDVSRPIVASVVREVEASLVNEEADDKLILITENAGAGKTTVLRRVAYELARRGIRTLLCSALSRISAATASVIDLIDDPLVIVVDNFADQATSVSELLLRIEKKDLVILASERAYRLRYLNQVLSGTGFRLFDRIRLRTVEVARLIDRYTKFGLVGDYIALKHRDSFARAIVSDPIAVACCRIMNDFKPLDRIVEDLIGAGNAIENDRYLMVALAQHCFMGGLRYEVLTSTLGDRDLSTQLERSHPLPLAYFDSSKTFLVPENSTLAERILSRASEADPDRLLKIFIALANGVAPRVNRQMIIQRTPEARLSGRLFDYDDIAGRYLKENAESFYSQARPAWKWNSRYWEQVSLLNLALYYKDRESAKGLRALENAVQHARHAVSIELHPFCLSTLGKVLMTKMLVDAASMTGIYKEAFRRLKKAIQLEASWSRSAVQPYVSLFSGTINYLDRGGVLSQRQLEDLRDFIHSAERRLSRDFEVSELIGALSERLMEEAS